MASQSSNKKDSGLSSPKDPKVLPKASGSYTEADVTEFIAGYATNDKLKGPSESDINKELPGIKILEAIKTSSVANEEAPLEDATTGPNRVEALPQELLDDILKHLSQPPPSQSKIHLQPDFEIASSPTTDLKSASLVCKLWRKSASPYLYKHTCLKVREPTAIKSILNDEDDTFFDFIERNNLKLVVESFVLAIKDQIPEDGEIEEDFQAEDITMFWMRLFTVVNPVTLTIVANPRLLGPLTGCEVNTRDAWSFTMPYHLLNLRRSPDKNTVPEQSKDEVVLNPIRPSLLFTSKPWTHILINEGSFINAYKTYDHPQKQPASIIPDLLGANNGTDKAMIPHTIEDFSYVAMFPLSTHFCMVTENLPRIDRLYVQFVPRSEDWMSPTELQHLDPNDLWLERNDAYTLIMRELFSHPPSGNFKFLREFESGDSADTDAWRMAVEYVRRAGGGWKVASPGVFAKERPVNPDIEATAAIMATATLEPGTTTTTTAANGSDSNEVPLLSVDDAA